MTTLNLQLAGRTVSCAIVRSARRSIGLQVGPQGLRVTLPQRFPLKDLESMLQSKAAWILRKLQALPPPSLGTLSQIDWLGVSLPLRLGAPHSAIGEQAIELACQDQAQIAATLQGLFRQQARPYLCARTQYWAAKLQLSYAGLRLSSARTRWGSCSSAGNINLNWRLLQLPPAVIDYVIIHELCHLQELNHSPRFWALVEAAYPDYRQAVAWLKQKGSAYMNW